MYRLKELMKFLIVGSLVNIIGYLLYILITQFGISPQISMTVVYFGGTFANFYAQRRWVFSQTKSTSPVLIRYVMTYLSGYCLNWSFLEIFVTQFGYSHEIVQGVSLVAIALYIFLMLKFCVFLKNSESSSASAQL